MNLRSRSLILALIGLLSLFPAAAAQTVTGEIKPVIVQRGKAARGIIRLDIPADLHVNSNRPSGEYLIPTTVIAVAKGARVGRVIFPKGVDRKFVFSDVPLNVYDGKVAFSFGLRVPKNFRERRLTVDVTVRYQACNQEVCFPPQLRRLTLEADVRQRGGR